MARNLIDRDRGYKALMAAAHAASRPAVVRVGILNDEPKSDGVISLIEVALIHEFGLGNVPERSFIRGWADENEAEIKRRMRALAEQVVTAKLTQEQALNFFGLWAVAQIKRRIVAGIAPALEPETVARKGSSTPLVDTGQLINSIQHRVEEST
jgi:hypothetical protein